MTSHAEDVKTLMGRVTHYCVIEDEHAEDINMYEVIGLFRNKFPRYW